MVAKYLNTSQLIAQKPTAARRGFIRWSPLIKEWSQQAYEVCG